jgi:predicted ATPase
MADLNAGTNRLVGRDRELATLGSFLGDAVAAGATLLLTGEPGVGKTALLDAAAEMAAADGVRVIRGGGVEYETDVSFAGLHQLVDVLSDDLRGLPRSSRASIEVALGIGSGPAPDRLAVLTASLALFRQAASTVPLLIVIDDLHWLDRASGAVVGFKSPNAPPLFPPSSLTSSWTSSRANVAGKGPTDSKTESRAAGA